MNLGFKLRSTIERCDEYVDASELGDVVAGCLEGLVVADKAAAKIAKSVELRQGSSDRRFRCRNFMMCRTWL
jgi:hypothetical protein